MPVVESDGERLVQEPLDARHERKLLEKQIMVRIILA